MKNRAAVSAKKRHIFPAEVELLMVQYRSGWDPHRGADNISTKSSDSDVSDISAVSRTSSASRFSSTSYMSVQSERPRGSKKIRPKGVEEGGKEGDKHEEIVHEVKEERINEHVKGNEITKTSNHEKTRESGDEEKTQDIHEQGKEKEQWNKEDLQRRFSQDDDSVFTSKMQSRQVGASGKNMTKSTSISGDMCSLEKSEGSQSDTAVGALGPGGHKRRSSIGAKMVAIVGLSRKSRSASQLSQTVCEQQLPVVSIASLQFLSLLKLQAAPFSSSRDGGIFC
ncbi:Regulating synaptic membrane exocytosis protein 2 [Myotis brandtii]|uniref:Regulating synaptic membrane exocytosis protein 2 n=1 Tax=Myotis brandtii TaxID=109478 RepID=S7Q4P5_MYOBR|nr:Regulating synaptic membrane exocytosis protein 2 [Myotis brandtii]